MNTFKKLLFVTSIAVFGVSCVKVNFDEDGTGGTTTGNTDDPNQTRILQGSYERDITLDGGTYTLKGYVYFTSGTTLKIPEGALLKSDVSQKGALIIERGAKVEATGSASKPIVFTSGKPAGQRQRGDWGGIILLGKAPTNRPLSPAPLIEGGVVLLQIEFFRCIQNQSQDHRQRKHMPLNFLRLQYHQKIHRHHRYHKKPVCIRV